MRLKLVVLSALLMVPAGVALGAGAPILPLSEIRKGMTGYGLTVFEGDRVERFDVEIVGVLEKIAPGQDLILARVSSEVTDRAGVIAGMSGSPIYVDGKIIGALAYSWQFSKEPIAGITPIEQMLRMEGGVGGVSSATPVITSAELLELLADPTAERLLPYFERISFPERSSAVGALPLAIPLALSGFESDTVRRFENELARGGFLPVPAGSVASGRTEGSAAPLKEGDAFAAVLAEGDFSLAATGTITYVDGDRVLGFGHPFLSMGAIDFPMARSEIVTILPNLAASFKLANTGPVVGSLTQDRAFGVVGYLGRKPDLVPVTIHLDSAQGPKTFRVNIVRNSTLFPLVLALTADSIVSIAEQASGERTVRLDSVIRFNGSGEIHLREGWAGIQARRAIPLYLAVVSNYLLSNEFMELPIEGVEIRLKHEDDLRIARVVEAGVRMPDDGELNPGDDLEIRVVLKPFRGEPFVETMVLRVPEGAKAGRAYLLVGSGTAANRIDFTLVPPDPRTLGQVVDVLERLLPSTELTARLYESADGRVSAGVYHPALPPTMQVIVQDDSSNKASMVVKFHPSSFTSSPLDYIVDGALKIDLDIRPRS